MKNILIGIFTTAILIANTSSVLAENSTVNTLMKSYQTQGATSGDAQRGETFWTKSFASKAPFTERSCKSCHTSNLKNKGEHVSTGKVLEPMAPSINSASLTDINNVKKWFKRNCKWTTGKECSAQEKADILAYIQQQ